MEAISIEKKTLARRPEQRGGAESPPEHPMALPNEIRCEELSLSGSGYTSYRDEHTYPGAGALGMDTTA